MSRFALLLVPLAALLGWECLPGTAAPVTLPIAAIALPTSRAQPDETLGGMWGERVLARPLFSPNRRPAPGLNGGDEAPPRLTGTIRTDAIVLAVFDAAGAVPGSAAKSIVVGLAGRVTGWTVIAIDDGVVTLERAGQSALVQVSFTGAPGPRLRPPPTAKLVLLHTKRSSPFLQW